MSKLVYQLRADVASNDLRPVAARLIADLRAAADQIERNGLSGFWENVPAAGGDADGFPRVKHALKVINSDGKDIAGPMIAPPDRAEPNSVMLDDLIRTLDRLAWVNQCVFPENVVNAANAHIAATGEWDAANYAQAYATSREIHRNVLRAYADAYAFNDKVAKRVLARAILNVGVKP